mmetsp:Transcript_29155/g.95120  ORF Transcript_29155/g.95120 Transcript_29155/m.95120 type:complete len:226 (+) Transcript_29155:182-859(+)
MLLAQCSTCIAASRPRTGARRLRPRQDARGRTIWPALGPRAGTNAMTLSCNADCCCHRCHHCRSSEPTADSSAHGSLHPSTPRNGTASTSAATPRLSPAATSAKGTLLPRTSGSASVPSQPLSRRWAREVGDTPPGSPHSARSPCCTASSSSCEAALLHCQLLVVRLVRQLGRIPLAALDQTSSPARVQHHLHPPALLRIQLLGPTGWNRPHHALALSPKQLQRL